jgi:tRNA-specific 2-thiouridylase
LIHEQVAVKWYICALLQHFQIPFMTPPRKAVALISGGLDSMLAARVMLDQGIHVEGINFFTGFCVEGHTHAIRNKDQEKKEKKRNNALWTAEQLGIKLHIIDIIEPYKDVVLNPKHGYGANLNPCLDCKIFMVKEAHKWMLENSFDFIITGEVVGQRPKSQRKETMPIVQKESGIRDLLLRPLCAHNLPETLPEREGWVDRNKLLDFHGRNRKPQMALAKDFGLNDYAQPAGGCCFLTDANYSSKLQDMWNHRPSRDYTLDDIILLKVGRHIRPRDNFKIIIARDSGETRYLGGYKKQFKHLIMRSHSGPITLIEGDDLSELDIQLAAAVAARYGQGREAESVEFEYSDRQQNSYHLSVKPLSPGQIESTWMV